MATRGPGETRDFFAEVGFGAFTGYRRITALGNNPDISVGVVEDVWTGGGLYPFLTAATSLELVSTTANDTSAGTGARTVRIDGLDINYVEVSQTITLNGTTPVAVPTQLFRINSMIVLSAGSLETNDGTINLQDAGAGTIRSIIPLGVGITRQSVFTVPAGNTLQIISELFGINRPAGVGRFATFATFFRTSTGVRRLPFEISIGDEPPYRHDGVPGIIVAEKTDFLLRCTSVSSNNTDVTAGWLGIMKLNTSE